MGGQSTDQWAGVAAPVQPTSDPWSGVASPLTPPKTIDSAAIQQTVQSNLAAQPTTPDTNQTFPQKLDQGMGMPVSNMIGNDKPGAAPAAVPPTMRDHVINAYNEGSASSPADFMQQAIPAAAHTVSPQPVSPPNESWGASISKGIMIGLMENAAAVKSTGLSVTGNQPTPDMVLDKSNLNLLTRLSAGFAKSYPEMAGASLGAGIGSMVPGEGKFIAAPVGAAVGAGFVHVALNLAPMYADELKQTKNPDKAWQNTVQRMSLEAPTTGLSFAAFQTKPFQGILKNMVTHLVAMNITSGTQQAGQNIETGQPATKGVGQSMFENTVSLLPFMLAHHAVPYLAHPDLTQLVASKLGKPISDVTQQDVGNAAGRAGETSGIPHPNDFVATAAALGVKKENLQNVYRAAGIKPVQIYEDARQNPKILEQIAQNKIPDAYADKIDYTEAQQHYHEQKLSDQIDQLRQPKPTEGSKYPILNWLKKSGQVDPNSEFGKRLQEDGITNQSPVPGIFKEPTWIAAENRWLGKQSLEGKSPNDLPSELRDKFPAGDQNAHMDLNGAQEAIRNEVHRAGAGRFAEDPALHDLSAELQQRGIQSTGNTLDVVQSLLSARAEEAKQAALQEGVAGGLTDSEAKEVARLHAINPRDDIQDAIEQVIRKNPAKKEATEKLSDIRDETEKSFASWNKDEMQPEDWEKLENEWKQAQDSSHMEPVAQGSERPDSTAADQGSSAAVNGPSGVSPETGGLSTSGAGSGGAGGGNGEGGDGGGPVGGAEGSPERAMTDKEIAEDLYNRLHIKAGQDHATDIQSMQRELSLKETLGPKLDKKAYFELETPNSQELTKKEQELFDAHIKEDRDEERELYEKIKELNGEKEAEADVGENKNYGYVHRIVKGKGSYLDRFDVDVGGDDDLGFGRKTGISQTTSSLMNPEFYVLEDEEGNRKLESGEYPDGYKPGDKITDEDNNTYTVQRAKTEEIERHTDLKYYKSAVSSLQSNIRGLRKTLRNIEFLNDLKTDMQKSGLGVPPSVENHPNDYRTVDIPQLRGWSFDPRIAEVLNDFYDRAEPGMLHQVNNLLIKGMFLNPIPHMENIFYDALISRGFNNLNPMGAKYMAQGIQDVMNFSPEYIDALENGAALRLPAVWKQGFYEKLQGQFLSEMRKSAQGLELAKAWGFDSVDHMASSVFNSSQKAMWGSGDALLMSRIRELKANHPDMTTKDAIEEAQKHIVDYRIPPRVGENILGPKLSRALSKALQDNSIVVFTRYHSGLFKSLGNIVKDAAVGAYKADPKKFAAATGQMFALMFLAHVVNPAIGAVWSSVMGDKEKFRRPGLTGLEGAIEDFINGKGLGNALSSQFIVSPGLKVGSDFLSDKIVDTSAGHVGIQAADYAMKQPSMTIPSIPYNMAEGNATASQEALKQIGVTPEKDYKPRKAGRKKKAKFESEENNLFNELP